MPLVHGSNELQIVLTVNDESKILTMGTIGYDACIDSDTMCLSLSWTDGLDPDLHSYYFPDWTYNEETTNSSFDNSSRGPRYWIYSNAANKKYSVTGDTIQQSIDGTVLLTMRHKFGLHTVKKSVMELICFMLRT